MKNILFWFTLAALPSFWLGYGIYTGAIFDIDQIHKFTGEWAFRLMILVLCLTPMKVLFKLNVNQLYKPLGLSLFYYLVLHAGGYFLVDGFGDLLHWYLIAGIGAFLIYGLMALTSNKFSQKKLKKNWKRLHRLTHLATWLVVLHVLLQYEKLDIGHYVLVFSIYIALYSTMKLKGKYGKH